MSLSNEYTDNFFMDESSILDAHLRLLFRAYHYETPCSRKRKKTFFIWGYYKLWSIMTIVILNTYREMMI